MFSIVFGTLVDISDKVGLQTIGNKTKVIVCNPEIMSEKQYYVDSPWGVMG